VSKGVWLTGKIDRTWGKGVGRKIEKQGTGKGGVWVQPGRPLGMSDRTEGGNNSERTWGRWQKWIKLPKKGRE